MSEPNVTVMPDLFDRQIGALHGLPDVLHTKATMIQDTTPVVGDALTVTVQTYRQPERGDSIFLQVISKDGTIRLVLPGKVSNAIARQREALTAKSRSKKGKANAQARKDAGLQPGFMKKKA